VFLGCAGLLCRQWLACTGAVALDPQTCLLNPSMTHSKRLEKFRKQLIKEIPRFPYDKASLQELEKKPLTDLLIAYSNWKIRYVASRPRTASLASAVTTDPRLSQWSASIAALIQKVQKGDDLTPHLSLQPHTRGYTPASSAAGASDEDRWSDKDMLLNVMGYHHFHIGPASRSFRSDELAFARVTRGEFEVIAIFDHRVFDAGSSERLRLHSVHGQELSKNTPPGRAILAANATMSGTHVGGTMASILYVGMINKIDPLLDDPARAEELRTKYKIDVAAPPKLSWELNHLDLCLFDKSTSTRLILCHGPT
jgi:hypothetical protein